MGMDAGRIALNDFSSIIEPSTAIQTYGSQNVEEERETYNYAYIYIYIFIYIHRHPVTPYPRQPHPTIETLRGSMGHTIADHGDSSHIFSRHCKRALGSRTVYM